MDQNKINEHVIKEALKRTVDNSPNYTTQMKTDLKAIIDAGRSEWEIVEATIAYFAGMRFY